MDRRGDLLDRLHAEDTTIYRLFHGAVEGQPGVTVDRYGPVLLVQTWRDPLDAGDLEALASRVASAGLDLTPVWNHRHRAAKGDFARFSDCDVDAAEGTELGLRYAVTPRHRGRDPLLFVDFRAARRLVRDHAEGREVLNLFSYTCGIGVAAAAGGAREAVNVDFGEFPLEVGRDNAARNGLSERFTTVRADCIPYTRQLAGLGVRSRRGRRTTFVKAAPRAFDLVVLDPPSWATSAFGAVDLVRDYPTVFKPALLATREGGRMLVTNHVASVPLEAWLDVLERAAAKAGRPLRGCEVIHPEEDVPSPDGRPPLKMAWLAV